MLSSFHDPNLAVFLLLLSLSVPGLAKEKYQHAGPIHLDRDGEKWAEKTLRKLSLEEKVGQLFMVWVRAEFLNVNSPEYLQLRDTMSKYHVGSFAMTVRWEPPFLYRSEPYEAAELLNRLQQESKLPLLFAADFERGVTMRLHGATTFPHAMAFGAAGKDRIRGGLRPHHRRRNPAPSACTGISFPMPTSTPIPRTRSSTRVPSEKIPSRWEISWPPTSGDARANGMMTTAKHFPGHGDTATDSHLSVAQVTGDRARLDSVELAPFRKAIAAGVDSVMVAHVTVPALEPDPNRVATTSPAIVTDLLKHQLGFQGIVVTDALDMAGLTRLYAANIGRAAVDAFKAGSDLLLIPADLDASYNAVLEAARSGEIPSARLDASVLKLLKAKASLGLHKARLVDVNALPEIVGKPENLAMGQQIADDAVTLVRDNGKLLPLKQSGTVKDGLPYQHVEEVRNGMVAVVLSEDVRTESGRALERAIKARVPDANVIYVDPRIAAAMSEEMLKAVDQAQAVIAAVYVVPTAGKAMKGANGVTNSVALNDASGTLLQAILDHAAQKTAVLAMGNPYVAQDFPAIQNYRLYFFQCRRLGNQRGQSCFLARSPFMATCRSVFPTSLSAAPASSGRLKSQRRDRNMRMLKLRDGNSRSGLIILVAFGALAGPCPPATST